MLKKPREDRLSQRTVPVGGGLGWVGAFLLIVAAGSWWVSIADLPTFLEVHRSGMEAKVIDFTVICGGAGLLMLMGFAG